MLWLWTSKFFINKCLLLTAYNKRENIYTENRKVKFPLHDSIFFELVIFLFFILVKIGRLRWLGHLFRRQELDPCRKLTLLKPERSRLVGRPMPRWLESVEDLKNMDVRNWRHKSHDQEEWRTILEEAKVHQEP